MNELMPCKCCGNINQNMIFSERYVDIGIFSVGPFICCDACGEMSRYERDGGYLAAVNAWNRRFCA